MTNRTFKHKFKLSLALLTAMQLGACGGGSGSTPPADSPPPPAATTVSGTAAAGAPIIGQVTVKGALGNSRSALIEADGSYSVDVTGLTAPYRLRAEGTVGGRTYKLHSYAEAADVGGTVNITPFTDLIIANAASQVAESYFDSATPAELDPAEIDTQEAALKTKLQEVFSALGVSSAIDLLNATFSADHSGLDAALDVVRVTVDSGTNVATITNLIEGSSITDVLTDTTDNTTSLTVTDPAALTSSVSDTQAIANIFTDLAAAFASGLPTEASIQDYFAADFLENDHGKSQFLTSITTDPSLVGLMFSGVSVEITSATTANVSFTFGINGDLFADEIVEWSAVKDATLGWQLRGDQRIADVSASYQCTENTSVAVPFDKKCSFHVNIEDADFTNNPTPGTAIASATATIVDGTTGLDKAVIFLDTPPLGAAGYLEIYNNGNYTGDYQPFGTGAGEIDPTATGTTFLAGDSVRIDLYESALDTNVPSSPAVVGTPVASYYQILPYAPFLDAANAPYPAATAATLTAAQAYTLGNDLTVSWTLAEGTRNSEIALLITDSNGAGAEVWIETFGSATTSRTISWADLSTDAALLSATDAQYNVELRIYANDPLTGQSYLTQYFGSIPGPAAGGGGGGGTSLVCGYESGWDDTADGGMGAPITPNSFADYETVIADCGTAMAFTAADVAGSSFGNAGETTTFNDTAAAGTAADPETGVFDDGAGTVINFEWYVEAATCSGCTHSYVVLYSDSSIDPANVPAGVWLRETSALTGMSGTPGVAGTTYVFTKYSEQSNYSDADRASGSDGEIWVSYDILQ